MRGKQQHASKKLKNVNAVRQMLAGTHSSQTKKVYGWDGVSDEKREVGETWYDEYGYMWEQEEGYKIKHGRFDDLREEIYGTKYCSNLDCGNAITSRLDKKYFNIHKLCEDCSIKLETKMRIDGTWDEYEKNRIKQNVVAFLKDAETEKEHLKGQLGNIEYVLENGDIEKWHTPEVKPEQVDQAFSRFRKNLLSKYHINEEEYLEKIGEKDAKK